MFGLKRKERNRKIKLFLDALRSGDYRQGRTRLKAFNSSLDDFEFCALGVLGQTVAGDAQRGYALAQDLFEDFNITSTDIWGWNDGDKLTFPQIADKLEQRVTL